jgi:hypothetical protein
MRQLGSETGRLVVFAFILFVSAPRAQAVLPSTLCSDVCGPAVDCTEPCEVCAPPYSVDGSCLHGTRVTTCARRGAACCASRTWVLLGLAELAV